jgi:response regulator RpfG family c-di-GMP phosphodiesterase
MDGDEAVLIVDDDDAMLAALRRALRGEPYDVLTALDPATALETLVRLRVDLVVADQRMPAMRGTELLALIEARAPEIARIVLTAYPDEETITCRRERRIDRLLTKPCDDSELRLAIRQLLATKRDEPRAPLDLPHNGARVVRVDCAGVSVRDVALILERRLRKLAGSTASAVVVLESLPSLRGSVMELLRRLRRAVGRSRLRAYVVDPSGLATAFLGAMGGPLVALERESDAADVLAIAACEDGVSGAG